MQTQAIIKCLHCNEETKKPINNSFCCYGCYSVYKILNTNGLSKYYEILKNDPESNPSSLREKNQDYTYMDEDHFFKDFVFIDNDKYELNFYLEGIHCLACLWLLEKLPHLNSDIIESRLNMGSSILSLKVQKNSKISSLATSIATLGYKPHPIANNSDHKEHQRTEEKTLLFKIGIAGFSLANIMLYSISLYGGADGFWSDSFGIINLALVSPVIFYSATPFYKSSFYALKNRTFNIDIPISFAIIFSFLMGIFQLIIGNNESYFDSISSLVFLLLSSRYLVKKMQQNALNFEGLSSLIQSKPVSLTNGKMIHPTYLERGDHIIIQPGNSIPVDGKILSGESFFNFSLLTGESIPVQKMAGDLVYSGTINLSNEITLEVNEKPQNSKLGRLLKEIEVSWLKRPKIVSLTDQWAKKLYACVAIIALGTFIYTYFNFGALSAFDRTLAVIIITCPCALGLATPLAMSLALRKASKKGIIVKDDETIEKLSRIDSIYFDKTGTLTKGHFDIESISEPTSSNIDLIYSLERYSSHPIAISIREYLKNEANDLDLNNRKEIPGFGVQAEFQKFLYEIKSLKSSSIEEKQIGLFKDNNLICSMTLKDSLKKESFELIKSLNLKNIKSHIISGDQNLIVEKVAKDLSITSFKAELTPEEKVRILKSSKSLFVGDGANDSKALAESYIGLAVKGSVDISMRAASIFLTNHNLLNILDILSLSKRTMKTIQINIIFSIVYNIFGLSLAVSGYISPLIAAILMPISSFIVLINTIYQLSLKNKE